MRRPMNCNDYSIGVELEGLEGKRFDAAVGHEHVAPTRKHDPGDGFDWTRLRRTLRWAATRVPCAPMQA